jgi:hypothetical protein
MDDVDRGAGRVVWMGGGQLDLLGGGNVGAEN